MGDSGLTLLLQRFDISPSAARPLPGTEDAVGGLTIGPQPFHATVTRAIH